MVYWFLLLKRLGVCMCVCASVETFFLLFCFYLLFYYFPFFFCFIEALATIMLNKLLVKGCIFHFSSFVLAWTLSDIKFFVVIFFILIFPHIGQPEGLTSTYNEVSLTCICFTLQLSRTARYCIGICVY